MAWLLGRSRSAVASGAIATVHEQALSALRSSRVTLLTTDVFDTLVWRPTARPAHLFVTLGERLAAAGLLPPDVSPAVFAGGRVEAELRARHEALRVHDCAECTLDEIWELMPARWRRSDHDWSEYITVEFELERATLQALPDNASLLAEARRCGTRIALVSDTYFSPGQLRTLVESAGIPLDADDLVATSSAERLNKSDGLLSRIIERAGATPATTLHIGDHLTADVERSLAIGADAVHLDIADDDRAVTSMETPLEEFSEVTGTDGGAAGLTRQLLLRRPRHGDHEAAYEFGVAVGGPMLSGFADWLVERCEHIGVGRVHYLLREGAFLADVVAASRHDAPGTVLLHASRWVNMRASVLSGTPDELFRSIARREMLRPAHVADAFDVPLADVERVIGTTVLDDHARMDAVEAIGADDVLREQIVASSRRLRDRLRRYLEQRIAPDDGRIVVCDIGWGGTIQESLVDLFDDFGWDIEVHGLYLMLSPSGERRVHRGARMHAFLPHDGPHRADADVIVRTPEIAEQLCTPELGTFRDLDDRAEPVTAPVVDSAAGSRRAARQGVLDYAALRAAECPDVASDVRLASTAYRGALLAGFAGAVSAPRPALAAELGTWEHDDVSGTGHEPLVDPDSIDLVAHLNAADTDLLDMRDLFWTAGAAAVANPPLAAQLQAVHQGVDPDLLCPRSEIGAGLIALFAPGSTDAVAQSFRTPHRNASGWQLLRLSATSDVLRDIRIDLGEHAGLVELGHVRLRLTGAAGERCEDEITETTDRRLHWHGSFPLGSRHAVVVPGGSTMIDGSLVALHAGGLVEVDVAFRAWALDDGAHGLSPSAAYRLRRAAERSARLARAARRRLT